MASHDREARKHGLVPSSDSMDDTWIRCFPRQRDPNGSIPSYKRNRLVVPAPESCGSWRIPSFWRPILCLRTVYIPLGIYPFFFSFYFLFLLFFSFLFFLSFLIFSYLPYLSSPVRLLEFPNVSANGFAQDSKASSSQGEVERRRIVKHIRFHIGGSGGRSWIVDRYQNLDSDSRSVIAIDRRGT